MTFFIFLSGVIVAGYTGYQWGWLDGFKARHRNDKDPQP